MQLVEELVAKARATTKAKGEGKVLKRRQSRNGKGNSPKAKAK
jgi:hypothetical protein